MRLASADALSFLRDAVGDAVGDPGLRLERPNKLRRRVPLRAVPGLSATDATAVVPDVPRIGTPLRGNVGLPVSRSADESKLLRRATLAANCAAETRAFVSDQHQSAHT